MSSHHVIAPAARQRPGADTEGVSFDVRSNLLLAFAIRLVVAMRRDIAYQHETALGPDIRAYLEYYESRRQPRTLAAYEETLRWLALKFPKQGVNDISADDLEAWISFRWPSSTMRPATIRQRMAAIKSFFKWAQSRDKLTGLNPTRRFDPPPLRDTNSGRKRHRISDADLERLITRQKNPSDRVAIQLLGKMGLRRDELRQFRLADFDPETGYVTVANGKGGKQRQLPTANGLREQLTALAERANGEHLISPRSSGQAYAPTSMPYWWEARLKEAGLDDVLMHELRYTAASRLYELKQDIVMVQRFLGHSSPTITEHYLDLNPESLEDALAALG